MAEADRSRPVIVMVEADNFNDREDIHQWFEDSRFRVVDAVNVFDALEAFADFTVRDQPEVVLLNVDCCDVDLPMIRTTFAAASGENSPYIIGVTNHGNDATSDSCYQGDLAQIAARLDRLIPNRHQLC